jgi:hypothetical protein
MSEDDSEYFTHLKVSAWQEFLVQQIFKKDSSPQTISPVVRLTQKILVVLIM